MRVDLVPGWSNFYYTINGYIFYSRASLLEIPLAACVASLTIVL